jgi:peroxiredoxin
MPNPNKGLPPGKPAPDFALTATDDTTVRLSDYRGRWVVLLFFRGTF